MPPCHLTTYQTLNLFKKVLRPPGAYTQLVLVEANSILSTLVVDQLDGGSVDVLYEEILSGSDTKLLKQVSYDSVGIYEFWTHPFHNSIKITITTTDQTIFTLKATGRTDTEILRTSSFDQDTFLPTDQKALPIACLDEDLQQLFFLRCKNGALITDPIDTGNAVYLDGEESSDPGNLLLLDQFTVGVGLERRLSRINVSCTIAGKWVAAIGATVIAVGRTASAQPDSIFEFNPRRVINSGETFTLKYQGRGPTSDVNYHVQLNEVII